MKLAYLEFSSRYYPPEAYNTNGELVNTDKYIDAKVRLTFDRITSMTIDENVQVCTAETIRGRNKTFNAYTQPINISLSGEFGDYQTTNIEVEVITNTIYDKSVFKSLLEVNKLTGKDKSSYLDRLFTSMVNDTRVLDVKTFYKTYENYVINNFNLVYIDNKVISVELALQQMLFRDIPQQDIETPYQIVTESDEEEFTNLKNSVTSIIGGSYGQ